MDTRPFPELIGALLKEAPGTTAATALQHACESQMRTAMAVGGRRGGEALVESLAGHGHSLKRVDALRSMWLLELPKPRVLEIWYTGDWDDFGVGALSYRRGEPWGSPKQRAAAKLQVEFYKRFEKLGRRRTLTSAKDRLIVRIGELEADVNNGGFDQYLQNKGTKRARAALAALKRVGAKKTARWLESAIKAGPEAKSLRRLDSQFFEKGEDLAVIVMTYLGGSARR